MEKPTISMTIEELRDLLTEQKDNIAKYITRNLSVYGEGWDKFPPNIREELTKQVYQSPFPQTFQILQKFIK